MTSFYSRDEIESLGLGSFGANLKLSRKASLYNPAGLSIGSHVRIDDFCVLSAGVGGIEIGDHVHIAVYSSLIGAGTIKLGSFSNISSRVSIYSSNDDYSGESLTNPTVPDEFKRVRHADVIVGKHVILGSGVVVLPGVNIEEGVAVGSLSLVPKDCKAFGIYGGIPVKRIGDRSRILLDQERDLVSEERQAL